MAKIIVLSFAGMLMNKLPLLIIPLSLSGCYLVQANYNKPPNRLDGSQIENEIRCEARVTVWGARDNQGNHLQEITEIPCEGPFVGEVPENYIILYKVRAMEYTPYRPCEGEIAHIDGKRWCVGPWSDELVWTFQAK